MRGRSHSTYLVQLHYYLCMVHAHTPGRASLCLRPRTPSAHISLCSVKRPGRNPHRIVDMFQPPCEPVDSETPWTAIISRKEQKWSTSRAKPRSPTHVFGPNGIRRGEPGQLDLRRSPPRQSWGDRGRRSSRGDLGCEIPAPQPGKPASPMDRGSPGDGGMAISPTVCGRRPPGLSRFGCVPNHILLDMLSASQTAIV